jgi:alpha-L-rhamnosidase
MFFPILRTILIAGKKEVDMDVRPWMKFCMALIAWTLFSPATHAEGDMVGAFPPENLRCEYLEDPVGIDVEKPRFSWVLKHAERGQNQTAFQLIVSTDSSAERADVWDSGKVLSEQSLHVSFEGKPLESDRTYFWKVRYWDSQDNPSLYSQVARFDTGLFREEDWEGEWIGGKNQLRKEFHIDGSVERGRVHVCGLGYYELRINGKRVGKNVLDPGYTTYEKRILYSSYDVTHLLENGDNAVGVMLGKGWSPVRLLMLQLNIELEGGRTISLSSDPSWKQTDGPIVQDSLYDGEIYDARMETTGWDRPGYDETGWSPVETGIFPKGILSAQMIPPIQVMDTIVPMDMTNPQEGVYVFDMGQNFSGWVELKVSGPRGSEVRMRHAELLYDNGMINQENLRSAKAEDIYILKGKGVEIYQPRFTYHGFRYVELTGFPGVPNMETIRGKVVHSAVRQVGNFSCSSPILNRLQHLIIWSQKTNLHSIPTDCNQRDERMGWLGDAHLTAEQAMMNFDMGAFYTKFIRDIQDVQDKEGALTDTVPHIWGRRPADPAWGTAYPLLCWYMYRYYGDKSLLESQYDGVKEYVEFLRSKAKDDLLEFSHYGDWVAIEKTPGDFVSSFYYHYDVVILTKMAEALGYDAEIKTYKTLSERIQAAIHKKYFDEVTKSYANGTQTANLLPLYLDIVPDELAGAVFGNLRRDILYENDTHLTTGIIGTKYLLDVLTKHRSSDLAYELATQTTYPSWGFMIANGATTLWELWQYKTGPSMNSHNHPMFGSVGTWLYQALVGIEQPEGKSGFKNILIQPQMVRDLRYVNGLIHTPRGRIHCSWSRSTRSLSLELTVPVNAQAEIRLPLFDWEDVTLTENGNQIYSNQKFLTGEQGIQMVEETDKEIIIKVGSGSYRFRLFGE